MKYLNGKKYIPQKTTIINDYGFIPFGYDDSELEKLFIFIGGKVNSEQEFYDKFFDIIFTSLKGYEPRPFADDGCLVPQLLDKIPNFCKKNNVIFNLDNTIENYLSYWKTLIYAFE